MALVRFTKDAPQQTGNQQHAGMSTQQSKEIYTRLYQTMKGIQGADLNDGLALDSAKQQRAARA